ncbi:hypothetical protein CDD83_9112 [Cordyceps sp. RAO-2017]|nr:hypothetical protein CDD83_9112 [Cordyceps sp. RAO-2017]
MAGSSVPATMRALVLTKAGDDSGAAPTLSFTASRPVPTPPAGHVLVRVHASAVHPSDLFNAAGGFVSTTFPRIPGRDFSGVVAAAAADSPQLERLGGAAVLGTSGATHGFTADGFQADRRR